MIIVYIIYSESISRYYCGQTANLDDRIIRHNSGRSKYTKKGVPWQLIHIFNCSDRSESVKLELKIKKRGIKRYLTDNDLL